jgi:hypothetical protein
MSRPGAAGPPEGANRLGGDRDRARHGDRPGGVVGRAGNGRYVAALVAVLLVAFTLHSALGSKKGGASIEPGVRIPPFAAPLAIGGPPGEVDIATHPNEGQAGRVPACSERGPGILNICQLYQRGPVVLALFFDAGSCAGILEDLQQISAFYPQVGFTAVGVREDAASVARLVRSKHITLPVGVDTDGRLATLYTMINCPEIVFVYRGGIVQSNPLSTRPSLATLRMRVGELLAASGARGGQTQ